MLFDFDKHNERKVITVFPNEPQISPDFFMALTESVMNYRKTYKFL